MVKKPLSNNSLLIVLLGTLLALSACQKQETDNDTAADTQAKTTNTAEPVINAKEIMDKTTASLDEAVSDKIEQMATIDPDLYDNPEAYLAMNAKKPGVVTTDSGLQYRVLKEGSGSMPELESRVKVHYRGTYPDGREFDSSYKRGKPAIFGVTQVIDGWTEALLLMNEGTKLELVIPPELAYGEAGKGSIPPNQLLKFEVELLSADVDQ